MKDNVERLYKILSDEVCTAASIDANLRYFAEILINRYGYIHKSDAVNYVDCTGCDCSENCKGKLVVKEELDESQQQRTKE